MNLVIPRKLCSVSVHKPRIPVILKKLGCVVITTLTLVGFVGTRDYAISNSQLTWLSQ